MGNIKRNRLISVIVPMYNVEKYLETCVYSIEKQTYSPIEIILVDDGSKDKTLEVANNLARKFSNIKVFFQKNQGQGKARNVGLKYAQGEFIAFIDSDDFIEPDMMSKLAKNMIDNNLDFVQCSFQDVYCEQNKKTCVYFSNVPSNVIMTGEELFRHHPTLSVCSRLYSHQFLKSFHFKFTENHFAEDVFDVPNIILHAKRVMKVDQCYYYYRRDNYGSTRNNKDTTHKIKLGCDKIFIANKLELLRKNFITQEYLSNLIVRNILGAVCTPNMWRIPGYKNAIVHACKENKTAKILQQNISIRISWNLCKVAIGKILFNKD